MSPNRWVPLNGCASLRTLRARQVVPDALDEGLQLGRHRIGCFLPFDCYLCTAGSAERKVQVVHSFALWNALAEDLQVRWCVCAVVCWIRLRYVASLAESPGYRGDLGVGGTRAQFLFGHTLTLCPLPRPVRGQSSDLVGF